MTSVNVTTTSNTVTVTEGDTSVVTVTTAGPQGATGAQAQLLRLERQQQDLQAVTHLSLQGPAGPIPRRCKVLQVQLALQERQVLQDLKVQQVQMVERILLWTPRLNLVATWI